VTAARIGAEDPRDLAALVEVVAGAGRGRRESRERHHTQDNRPTHVISFGQRRARRGLVRGDVDQDPVAISHLMLAERTGAAKQTLQGLAFRSRHRRGCETRVVGGDALHVLLEGVDVLDLEANVKRCARYGPRRWRIFSATCSSWRRTTRSTLPSGSWVVMPANGRLEGRCSHFTLG